MENSYAVKWVNCFFLVLIFLFIAAGISLAQGEFETAYGVTYEVLENGTTKVTQEISLTNLTRDYYASEYTLVIGSPRVANIEAFDSRGTVKKEVETGQTNTSIHLTFNDQIVGQGKKLKWTLKYDSLDSAVKSGQVWEINIPRLSNREEIKRYDVTLNVPTGLGPLMYISPEPVSQEEEGEKRTYQFSQEQIAAGGASAAFGEYQLFSFALKYHLRNSQSLTGIATIALPPSMLERQEITLLETDPKPVKVYQDDDGNTLADYKVPGRQVVDVRVQGIARIFNNSIDSRKGGSFGKLPAKLVEKYTRSQPFWEVDNAEIQTIVKTLIDRKKPVAENAQSIYNFVVEKLTYDKEKGGSGYLERKGAVSALNEPDKVVCMEFSDLFIAMSRAAGIPARELNGYAYTSDNVLKPLSIEFTSSDVLHSWPEFYDPFYGWVAIDPTWGSTTNGLDYFSRLDSNHFVFVVKGLYSETPLPAGAYKVDDETEGDVVVGFANVGDLLPEYQAKLEVRFVGNSRIRIKNTGQKTAFGVKASLESDALKIGLGKENSLGDILPGQEKEYKISLHSPRLALKADGNLVLILAYQNFDGEVRSEEFSHQTSVYPLKYLMLLIVLPPLGMGAYLILRRLFKKKSAELLKQPPPPINALAPRKGSSWSQKLSRRGT